MSKDLDILNTLANNSAPILDLELTQLGELALALVGGGSGAINL